MIEGRDDLESDSIADIICMFFMARSSLLAISVAGYLE